MNARELHGFLGNGKPFPNWIADRIKKYGFVNGVDYTTTEFKSKKILTPGDVNLGGRPTKEYHVSIDMAKELAMVERNDQGKQARLYFIEPYTQPDPTTAPPRCKRLPVYTSLTTTHFKRLLAPLLGLAERGQKGPIG